MKKLASLFVALVSLVWFTEVAAAGWLPLAAPCSQATTFLARASGLSGTETTATTNLICGLVVDGVITGTMAGAGPGATGCGTASFDALYLFATNSTTTANLNLCGTAFGLTQTGSLTFTADRGYTGDGATGFLKAGYVPSTAGGAMTQNSASVSVCILNARTTGSTSRDLSTQTGSTSIYIQALDGSGTNYGAGLNDLTFGGVTNANTQGSWIDSRTGSTNFAVYTNGVANAGSPVTAASVGLPTTEPYILANNNAGTANLFSPDQLAYAFWGGGFTSGQVASIYARLHTYLQAVGAGAC